MLLKKLNYIFLILSIVVFTTSCKKDDDDGLKSKGTVNIEITDAPIDDASVSATFVTISKIMIDGEELRGFNKTTIDLMAYQNGDTKLLSNYELDAKTYSQIDLVLDYDTDANGNSPGCYVYSESENAKHKLNSETDEIKLSYNFLVEENTQSNLVIDFDLRKCVKRDSNNSDNYEFVTNSEMQSGIRVINKDNVAVVSGSCEDSMLNNSDKIVVYAYGKGSFNRDFECHGQGESNIEFSGALTSSMVDANGNYELHFLEEGDYELHYVSYKENANGELEINGTLLVNAVDSIDLLSLSLNANANVVVNVVVSGIVPV